MARAKVFFRQAVGVYMIGTKRNGRFSSCIDKDVLRMTDIPGPSRIPGPLVFPSKKGVFRPEKKEKKKEKERKGRETKGTSVAFSVKIIIKSSMGLNVFLSDFWS